MITILVILGIFILGLLSNALSNLTLFDDEFAVNTDARIIILNSMLFAILIPLCLFVLFTRLVVYSFNKLSGYCSDKLLDYRLNKANKKSVKKDEVKEGAEPKEA